MNDLLDAVFTEVLSVAYDYGAGVIKWGGDATLLLFTGDHPRRVDAGPPPRCSGRCARWDGCGRPRDG